MSILKGTNLLLDKAEDFIQGVPVVGNALSRYIKVWQDYINDNAANELKHPEWYEIDPKTGKIKGIREQKFEDIPVGNELESANGKKFGGAGDLGPRSRIQAKEKIFKEIRPKIFSNLYPLQLSSPSQLPLTPLNQSNWNNGFNFGYFPINPIVKASVYPGKHQDLNFVSTQNENPNAGMGTSGFVDIYRDRKRPNNKKPIKKKYKVVI